MMRLGQRASLRAFRPCSRSGMALAGMWSSFHSMCSTCRAGASCGSHGGTGGSG